METILITGTSKKGPIDYIIETPIWDKFLKKLEAEGMNWHDVLTLETRAI